MILRFVVERGFYESPLLVTDSGAVLEHQARAAEKIEEICRSLGKCGVKCRAIVEIGVGYQAIVEAVKKVHANLIVISTHGRTGLAHVLSGSVAERVVQHAVCTVLVSQPCRSPSGPPAVETKFTFKADSVTWEQNVGCFLARIVVTFGNCARRDDHLNLPGRDLA